MSIIKRKKDGKLQGRCNSSVTNLINLCSISFSQRGSCPLVVNATHLWSVRIIKSQAATSNKQAAKKEQAEKEVLL